VPAAAGMTRAEKFEDEKRRVSHSCFGKQDLDGSGRSSILDRFGSWMVRLLAYVLHSFTYQKYAVKNGTRTPVAQLRLLIFM
jgi:hypothetical protein